MRDIIYGAIFTIVCVGLAYAADQRIDERVQFAIDEFHVQQLEQQVEFYITKEELAPQAVTPDDRVNKRVLERQLESLRAKP